MPKQWEGISAVVRKRHGHLHDGVPHGGVGGRGRSGQRASRQGESGWKRVLSRTWRAGRMGSSTYEKTDRGQERLGCLDSCAANAGQGRAFSLPPFRAPRTLEADMRFPGGRPRCPSSNGLTSRAMCRIVLERGPERTSAAKRAKGCPIRTGEQIGSFRLLFLLL